MWQKPLRSQSHVYRHTSFGSAALVSCLNWHTGAALCHSCLVHCEQLKAEKWRVFAVPIMQSICVKHHSPYYKTNGNANCYFRVKKSYTLLLWYILFSEVHHYDRWVWRCWRSWPLHCSRSGSQITICKVNLNRITQLGKLRNTPTNLCCS